jgi:UDP-N-acetylglucosamine/UDP-N-acetylgalactosamine diphosphorylase
MSDEPDVQLVRMHVTSAAPTGEQEVLRAIRGMLNPSSQHSDLCQIGMKLLAQGKVAVLTLAGGRSTRMGGQFRGDLPVGPITGRTLLQIQGERIAAIRQRYSPRLQWLIMCSEFVHESLMQSLRRHKWFGLPARDVMVFSQRSLPVLDEKLQPICAPDGTVVRSPTGHGGLFSALQAYNLIHFLAECGIAHLFIFQYPNVLEHICDPIMLGFHEDGGYDISVKSVEPIRGTERVGRLVQARGQVIVSDYHAIISAEKQRWLGRQPVFSGTAIFSLPFLRRCSDARVKLPYHVVTHHEPGSPIPAWKVEQFLSDLLLYADSTGVVTGRRAFEYAAIKTSVGNDSLKAARMALAMRNKHWLDQVGCVGPKQIERIEISPGYALCAAELAQRLPANFHYQDGLLLDLPTDPVTQIL